LFLFSFGFEGIKISEGGKEVYRAQKDRFPVNSPSAVAIPHNPQTQIFKNFYHFQLIFAESIVGVSNVAFHGSGEENKGHGFFGERSSPLMCHHRLEATGYDIVSGQRSISYEVSLFWRSPIFIHHASICAPCEVFFFSKGRNKGAGIKAPSSSELRVKSNAKLDLSFQQ
jgi:hypothetical protein